MFVLYLKGKYMVYLAVLMNIYAWIRVDFETRIGYTRISKMKLYYHVSVRFISVQYYYYHLLLL